MKNAIRALSALLTVCTLFSFVSCTVSTENRAGEERKQAEEAQRLAEEKQAEEEAKRLAEETALAAAREQFNTDNYAASYKMHDKINAGVKALLSCWLYYQDALDAGVARGEKWVYSNDLHGGVLDAATFEEMIAYKRHGGNCGSGANWSFIDVGIMPENAYFYGNLSGGIEDFDKFSRYYGTAVNVYDYASEDVSFGDLYNAGKIKAGDILIGPGHTYVYMGDRKFFATGHDSYWHSDPSAYTEDAQHAVFDRFIISLSECPTDYYHRVTYVLRVRDDYIPPRYRNAEGTLVDNPVYCLTGQTGKGNYLFDTSAKNVMTKAEYRSSFNLGIKNVNRLLNSQLLYDHTSLTYAEFTFQSSADALANPACWYDANGKSSPVKDETHCYLGGISFFIDCGDSGFNPKKFALYAQNADKVGSPIGGVESFDVLVSSNGKRWTVVYSVENAASGGVWQSFEAAGNAANGVAKTQRITDDIAYEGRVHYVAIAFRSGRAQIPASEGVTPYVVASPTSFRLSEFCLYR